MSGLLLHGTISSRRRRAVVQKDGKTRFVITLVVSDGVAQHLADRWSDGPMPDGTPRVGDIVALPVSIRAFAKSSGGAQFRLEWGPIQAGEEF